MPYRFFQKRPRLGFFIAITLCVGVALVVTQVQANIHDQSELAITNPHHLPDEFNPKLYRLDEKLDAVKVGVKSALDLRREDLDSERETLHSVVFKGRADRSRPTYDYATGTSN